MKYLLLFFILILNACIESGTAYPEEETSDPEGNLASSSVNSSPTILLSSEESIISAPILVSSEAVSSFNISSQSNSSEATSSSSSSAEVPKVDEFDSLYVYVVAHEDDWQLFMGEVAHRNLEKTNSKSLFVYLTAGEAGREQVFWNAREVGAMASIAQVYGDTVGNNYNESEKVVAGKNIAYRSFGNTSSYFLRIPDGNGTGTGFERHGYQSLKKLYQSSINEVSDVTYNNTYTMEELKQVIRDLVTLESQNVKGTAFYFSESDESINYNSHPDHVVSSKIGQEALTEFKGPKFGFEDYGISQKPVNLSEDEIDMKTAMWDHYDFHMINLAGYHTVEREGTIYYSWLERSYYRRLNH
jgi:LmbE family N-acetylglucosaminyl deacetylase